MTIAGHCHRPFVVVLLYGGRVVLLLLVNSAMPPRVEKSPLWSVPLRIGLVEGDSTVVHVELDMAQAMGYHTGLPS